MSESSIAHLGSPAARCISKGLGLGPMGSAIDHEAKLVRIYGAKALKDVSGSHAKASEIKQEYGWLWADCDA